MGDPQDRLRFVHIAGTNGKGSVAALTASVTRAAGYKTGLYTSPYLQRFTERIRVDGVEIPESEVARLAGVVRAAIDRITAGGGQHPTELEVVGAIAFLYFEQEGCEIVVFEVGLGGRYDPTNVIKTPLAAVITTIDYDHTAKLGGTLEAIAYQKAGIIKPGGEVVVYQQPESVSRVFADEAALMGARLTLCDFSSVRQDAYGVDGQRFCYGRYENLVISLLGDYQMYNAALVIETVEAINRNAADGGVYITDDALRRGLRQARWPGRMEILNENPTLLIDAAHNAQCAGALRNALVKYFPDKKIVYIFGVVRDKDYISIIDATLPIASAVFTVTTDSQRAVPAGELADVVRERASERKETCANTRGVRRLSDRIWACGSVAEAVRRALDFAKNTGAVVCSFGSLYYIGLVRDLFERGTVN